MRSAEEHLEALTCALNTCVRVNNQKGHLQVKYTVAHACMHTLPEYHPLMPRPAVSLLKPFRSEGNVQRHDLAAAKSAANWIVEMAVLKARIKVSCHCARA